MSGTSAEIRSAEPRSTNPVRAAYLHIPFCKHRCGYCDFTLVARRDDLIPAYLDALELEISRALPEPLEVTTLFVGGGTPTHLSASELSRFFDIVARWFVFTEGAEVSVEANPWGLTNDKIGVLADAGINRVSLGAQSFDAALLQQLERDHTAADIESAVERLRPRIPNLSLDLIFGIPGQSLELWNDTLDRAFALRPTHLSTYGLTFEKGTAFWSRREHGALAQTPDELERAMYATAMDRLPAAGYEQYELSNFARRGFACRHNQVYWAGQPYHGFGPGAARYLNGRRDVNHRSVTAWLRRIQSGQSPVGTTEELSPEDRAREAAVIGLRRVPGLNRTRFAQQTGFALDVLFGAALQKHRQRGWLEDDGEQIRLTREGRFVADSVVVDLL